MTSHSSSPTKTQASTVHRKLSLLLLAAILPLLTQCSGIGGYKSISYSKGKLATPPTTLSERDYPFDAKGRYRTDWVKRGSTKKRSKSGFKTAAVTPSQPSVTQAPPASTSKKATSQTIRPRKSKSKTSSQSMTLASNTTPSKKTTSSSKPVAPAVYTPPPAPVPPKPKPAATKPQARYHKIAKGDTLWGISRRYKVAVNTIKSANGLSSDLIRPGQTLRIP